MTHGRGKKLNKDKNETSKRIWMSDKKEGRRKQKWNPRTEEWEKEKNG